MQLKATEHQTQSAILELLTAEGVFAFRLNTARVRADGRSGTRYFTCHSLGAGAADIRADIRTTSVLHKGTPYETIIDRFVPVWLEVKAEGAVQSPEQESFQEHVERQGHTYAVVRSVNDVLDVLFRIRHQ